MRIVYGSGFHRSALIVCGSVRGASGTMAGALRQTRYDAIRLINERLFPTNGAFHKAKRRGERALKVAA